MSVPAWQPEYKYDVPGGKEVTIAEATAEEMAFIICDWLQGDSGFRFEDIEKWLNIYAQKVTDEWEEKVQNDYPSWI